MLSKDNDVGQFLKQQQQLWQQLDNNCRSRIGQPLGQNETAAAEDTPLLRTPAAIAPDDCKSVPRLAEYSIDGRKTEVIVTNTLYKRLAGANLAQVAKVLLSEAQTIVDRFSADKRVLALNEISPTALKRLSPLEGWLRQQPIKVPTSFPLTRAVTPFIIYRQSQANYQMMSRGVYWLDGGLSAALHVTRSSSPFWNGKRLQFSLPSATVLVCSGVLRGNDWQAPLVEKIKKAPTAQPKDQMLTALSKA